MTGKTVLITGASRGIGAAAARAFAAVGANVVLAARSSHQINALAEEIGDSALAIPCDVSQYDQVSATVDRAVETFGGLDFLINNAGIIDPIAPLEKSTPEDWGKVIDINVKGVYHGLRAAIPVMKSGGVIVNISSGAAGGNLEGWSHYNASKAAVLSLTKTAENETPDAIRVVGLSPGTVATDMQSVIKESGVNVVSKLDWSVHIPAEWVGKALVWLCGEDASEFRGDDVSLRDEDIRRRVGLIA
jgi:NAD(P)-dependent dehydrogenase (short-subunit alcohol dehydrogenase family)